VRPLRAAALALAAGLYGAGIAAPEAAEPFVSDEWHFQVTPYLWALALDGDVTVKGVKTSPSVSFKDIFDNLDYALMLESEARKGRFGIYANAIYASLSSKDDVSGVRLRVGADTSWVGAGGFYRLGPFALAPDKGPSGPQLVVDPYAGARFTYLNTELRIRDGGPQGSQDKTWVDPIFGVRTIWQLTPKWSVTALGDIGGFGVGSEFTWQAAGTVGYTFGLLGEDNAKVMAGYRALYQDYEDGHGANEFKWDMTLHGPMLALAIGF
jgi:hypothetical protein